MGGIVKDDDRLEKAPYQAHDVQLRIKHIQNNWGKNDNKVL
jgi:hypothetical protein